jgi:hypothetical protein
MSDIPAGYVITDDGQIFVQLPAENRWGFLIADDDQSWEGGFGLGIGGFTLLDEDDPRITDADRERLGWMLDGASHPTQDELRAAWDTLRSRVYRILDDEGRNMAEAKIRAYRDGYLYVDEEDGWIYMNAENGKSLIEDYGEREDEGDETPAGGWGFDRINDLTGFANGDRFESEGEVLEYFTPGAMVEMYGADAPDLNEAQLQDMADEVIRRRWHMRDA